MASLFWGRAVRYIFWLRQVQPPNQQTPQVAEPVEAKRMPLPSLTQNNYQFQSLFTMKNENNLTTKKLPIKSTPNDNY
jgi:hypothetical protein